MYNKGEHCAGQTEMSSLSKDAAATSEKGQSRVKQKEVIWGYLLLETIWPQCYPVTVTNLAVSEDISDLTCSQSVIFCRRRSS